VEQAIEEEVRGAVEVDPRVGKRWTMKLEGGEHDPTNFEYDVVVRGEASGVPFEARVPIVAHIQKSTCTRCGRKHGGYYESILQLRAEGRDIDPDEREHTAAIIDRVLTDLHRAGDLDSFLVRAKDVRGGWDFYFGTVAAGRAISKALAQEAGAALKETASLVGRDKTGIDLYRVTFSAKLPRARVGGFVGKDEKLYQVKGVGPKTATVLDLQDHKRTTWQRADLDQRAVLAPAEAKPAVVVSESERELQVLDPQSLKTVDIVKPAGFPKGMGSVRVVSWDDRLWLVPPSDADTLT
jgi:nonsense-mediated mRNA decay protein 3